MSLRSVPVFPESSLFSSGVCLFFDLLGLFPACCGTEILPGIGRNITEFKITTMATTTGTSLNKRFKSVSMRKPGRR